MTLRVGQLLHGVKWSYRLTEALGKGSHKSNMFKAQMLPGPQSSIPSQWALVKTTPADRVRFLKREYDVYARPAVASCSSIRAMYDMVGYPVDLDGSTVQSPPCLVFEWMDCSLTQLSSETRRHNPVLVKAICKAILTALVSFKQEGLIHTDIKPDNILLSNVDSPNPIVKLGDLGLAIPEVLHKSPFRPLTLRPPEVWHGVGHASDVWSFAATLLNWMQPGVFGTQDIRDNHWPGDVDMKFGSLEEQFAGMDMDIPPEVTGFLRYLLVVDHEKRPLAAEALGSREFEALG